MIKEYGYQPGPDLGEILTIGSLPLSMELPSNNPCLPEEKMSDFIVEKLEINQIGTRPF